MQGHNGILGDSPPIPSKSFDARSEWNDQHFLNDIKVDNLDINWLLVRVVINIFSAYGKKGKRGGDGGNGGVGGLGGLEGKTDFVGIENQPKFKVNKNRGPRGDPGNNGNGGASTRNGDSIDVLYPNTYVFFVLVFKGGVELSRTQGNFIPRGPDGKPNINDKGIVNPDPVEIKRPSESINSYKSFVRENLPSNIVESSLRKFMSDIEGDKRIQQHYNTMGFFHELQELENQYLHLRYTMPFIPFYESLAKRIDAYSKSTNESADHLKVLRFVYTAVLGKISNLRNYRNHISITDLNEYLEIVQKNIRKMNEIDKAVNIEEQRQQYHDGMKKKAEAGVEIINNEILPALFKAFGPLNQRIVDLIDIVTFKRDQAKIELQELQDKLFRQNILNVLRVFGKAFEAFTGMFAGITEIMLEGMDNWLKAAQGLSKLLPTLQKHWNGVIDFFKEKFYVYLDQLLKMRDIANWPNPLFNAVRAYIQDCIEKVNKYLAIGDKVIFPEEITKMRRHMDGLIKDLRKDRKDRKDSVSKAIGKLDILNVVDVAIAVWKAVKDNDKALEELYTQQLALKNKFNKWDERLKKIDEKLTPMFEQVYQTIVTISISLQSQTAIELDISSWKVNTVLGDLKLILQECSQDTSLENDLKRLVENIQETFSTLIKVYDRIQSYMDQSKFADYLANLNSMNTEKIADKQLRNAVTQMKKILQSNVIMEQYSVGIHSFKQHYFPFAAIYLATYDLSTGLQVNDTEILVRRATEEIDYLQEQVKFIGISIGEFDREIFGDIDFNSDDDNIAVPFYTFRSREYKDENRKLLTGEEVMIKADVTKGLNQNAVKFNQIGIKLILSDAKMQKDLDAELENFGVRMTMMGHNYYQCGKKFYYLSVDDSIVIEQSFKKDLNGKPSKYNEVYRKVSEKQYFLSPYTTWKVKLVVISEDFVSITDAPSKNAFDKLKKFGQETINMEFIGRGQYFRNNVASAAEICTSEMDKYYDFDSASSDVNSVKYVKYKYSLL